MQRRIAATALLLLGTAASAVAFTAPPLSAGFVSGAPLRASTQGKARLPTAASPRPLRTAAAALSMKEVAVTPDYRLALGAIGLGIFFNQDLHVGSVGWPLVILGSFLAFQTTQIRFRFTDTDLEVVRVEGLKEEGLTDSVESSGENALQGGGANKWSFSSVTNWEFWFPEFPILVYFKETQTKPEGQIHFFPIIMDGKELYEQMHAKMGKSVNPKIDPSEWEDNRPLSPKGFKKIADKLGL